MVLPPELIRRIEAYKSILAEVETSSLEDTFESFAQDKNPEREIEVWEHIAHAYLQWCTENSTQDIALKKEVFTVLFGASMGMPFEALRALPSITLLSNQQIEHLLTLMPATPITLHKE